MTRIEALVPDFRLEDTWDLPGAVGPGDFGRLVEAVAAYDPTRSSSAVVRALFAIRLKLGEWLGLDRPSSGVGARVPTLRDRLPADLRDGLAGPPSALGFNPLYLTDDEWAIEAANDTMHGVLHIGAADGQARLSVYVKPNGLKGQVYMAAIKPFRHLFVYPAIIREVSRLMSADPVRPRART